MRQSAFTLIELLVVIAILAMLAAILFPAISGATSNAQSARDSKQMGDLAQAILQWRTNIGKGSSLLFPAALMDLSDDDRGGPLDGELTVYVSPADPHEGHGGLGGGQNTDKYDYLHEDGCSYMYECSGNELKGLGSGDEEVSGAPAKVLDAMETWADYKRAQQKFGEDGKGISQDVLPVIRNWWHHDWDADNDPTQQRVLNAAWSTRVYWSVPKWENMLPDDD